MFLTFPSCSNEPDIKKTEASNFFIAERSTPTDLSFKLFTKISPSQSAVTFKNSIKESNAINYFSYEYIYNGGGVAIGDINNDGLPDLFFTANMSFNRLYLNKGNLQFEDISASSGIRTQGDWCTGVTMADVNGDGFLDIYVSRSGWFENPNQRRNNLFINNGDLTFTEQAGQYGIDDAGHTTQSVFFDMDQDNDLDLYVGNHPVVFTESLEEGLRKRKESPPFSSDQIYRNDGGHFVNISKEAGISNYAHSLGLIASDFDKDGLVDIFVSNDYNAPNFYYHNNGNGTFTDIGPKMLKHMAKFSMGVDAGDFNNDGLLDIFTTEMMAEDNQRQKTNMASMSTEDFWTFVDNDYGYQFMHNCLQLNNGNSPFSEIAYLSGVATTDWSWSPLIADFNNDGFKDLFVSNGYKRDVLDKDFKNKMKEVINVGTKTFSEIKPYIPTTQVPNYIFRNNHDLTFDKKITAWGLDELINTNGASYGDLDGDGDLDLVLSNLDQPVTIYRNNLMEQGPDNKHYLKVRLKGSQQNVFGLGTKVTLKVKQNTYYNELTTTRGFQSSVAPVLHFGLGFNSVIDELLIQWPDGNEQLIKNVKADQILSVDYANAKQKRSEPVKTPTIFKEVNSMVKSIPAHREKEFDDYKKQLLLPHKLSQFGPSLAVGDVNGDGLDDLFQGGAAGQAGTVNLQTSEGFKPHPAPSLEADKAHEDMGSIFFDADQDGDLDLYVVSGSYEFDENSSMLVDRLYFNDGKGNLELRKDALPNLKTNGSCVVAADFDQDGDLDLFVGGHSKSGKYPMADKSFILQNNKGSFKDVTEEVAPELSNIGLVNAGLWTDIDDDNDLDLMLVGEWLPITVFVNENGKFKNETENFQLSKTKGWWNTISGGDFDNDGDMDYIAGNLGLNSKNKATLAEPFKIFTNDFDNNGSYDVALGYYNKGVLYPVRGRQCSSEQVPYIAEKIKDYTSFGNATIEEVYGIGILNNAIKFEAQTFASSFIENVDGKTFKVTPLPNEAQFAPTYDTWIEDVDQDGCLDIIMVGNQYPVEIETGRYDAHRGLVLKGNCSGAFNSYRSYNVGLNIDGDAKAMVAINFDKSSTPIIIVSQNNGPLKAFKINDIK
ncbi:MAG: hypothetical protein ACI9M9_000736 [Flavobacteriaceae bacterium]|jgi:hypothetical protein